MVAMFRHFDDVNDWLSVGADLDLTKDLTGQSYEESIKELLANEVTGVVDCREEWNDVDLWVAGGLWESDHCYAPIVDSRFHTPPEEWYSTIETFVERWWLEGTYGDRLFVHCHLGVNRGPSAAMLALLTVEEDMTPWDAFMAVREARPSAGVVYADGVGRRHDPEHADEFSARLLEYWTDDRIATAYEHRGPYADDKSRYRIDNGGDPVVRC